MPETSPPRRTDLAGLGIAVTGGAGDIGSAMAAELLARGAAVTLIDHAPASGAGAVLARLEPLGDVSYCELDVTDRAAVDETLAAIEPLDVAIGNAGIVEAAPFLDVSAEEWRHQLDVNLTGCFNIGQGAARLMAARECAGRIIFTGSWVGEVPWPDLTAYSVSKAGVRMLARAMARELAPLGIRVNVIAPGIVRAGLAKHQLETDPVYARRVSGVIPLGDLGSAEQIGQATAFLCSPESSYMTGSVLLVDGGCSLFQFGD
jgi:NAD(P)-dependent dehydrogenase (short-subunit alcohol dehydrogenase family)